MNVALVHCASTQWQAEGRLLGRVELPTTTGAEDEVREWVGPLRKAGVATLYHGPDDLSLHTARALAKALPAARRVSKELAEVDVGLWAGMTEAQLEARFETVHHELCEDALNVHPPEGESFGDAAKRVARFLRKKLGRDDVPAVGLVLRPLLFAMARFILERRDFCELLSAAHESGAPLIIVNAALPEPERS